MDWKRAMEEERAALMRIVTLLGALAGLAELPAILRAKLFRSHVLVVGGRLFLAGGNAHDADGIADQSAGRFCPLGPVGIT